MPKNLLLFPEKFQLDGAVSDSGIGALEVAVNNLSIASKSGAMRQANAIRIGGLGSIKNQNRGMPTLNSLLPTRSVGKFTVAPSEPNGTVGYFIGGFGDNSNGRDISAQQTRFDRFTFATNTVNSLGSQTSISSQYTFGNSTYGYYCWAPATLKFFARFTFQNETISPIGSVVFPGRYQGASLKNQSRGYACGGISSSAGTIYGNVDRFSFAGEVCVSIGTLLQAKLQNFGFGNKFNGYVGGGATVSNFTSISNNIERFSYATELNAIISSVFTIGRGLLSTWVPSSLSAAYFVSGHAFGTFPTAGSAARIYCVNTIEKFTYAGETTSVLAGTIARGVRLYGAVGNSTRCIMGGGTSYTDTYEAQSLTNREVNEMRAFTYGTETHEILGSVLSIGRNSVAGLDNHGI
jgi:hypothetical protein